MTTIRKLIRYFSDRDYRMVINCSRFGMYKDMPDEVYLKRAFKAFHSYDPDLSNPKTLNEKLQWLKLYDKRTIVFIGDTLHNLILYPKSSQAKFLLTLRTGIHFANLRCKLIWR